MSEERAEYKGPGWSLPTRYKKTLFRSRGEARWAVFFDLLGIDWIYEPGTFNLDNGQRYIPDFYLRDQKCFWEYKGPAEFNDKPEQLAITIADYPDPPLIYVYSGPFQAPPYPNDSCHLFYPDEGYDLCHFWAQCPKCGVLDITFGGRTDHLWCECVPEKSYSYDTPDLLSAYTIAQSCKF